MQDDLLFSALIYVLYPHHNRSFDWLEDRKGSKKTRLPAKQFIDTSLAQIQRQLRDEQIFPTKFGKCSDINNCLMLHTAEMKVVETIMELHTLPFINS